MFKLVALTMLIASTNASPFNGAGHNDALKLENLGSTPGSKIWSKDKHGKLLFMAETTPTPLLSHRFKTIKDMDNWQFGCFMTGNHYTEED